MEHVKLECVVIGAGVIGLAIARQLALLGKEVMVLDKHARIGEGISSRNSEVIHAGIYYPQNSLKALLCVQGKAMLYAYCQQNQIPYRQTGKLIVAQDSQEQAKLNSIREHAIANGVQDVELLSAQELSAMEPALSSIAALYSPSTGIVDSHALMLQLQADLERAGGLCVFNTELEAVQSSDQGILLRSITDGTLISCDYCINACGLDAVAFCQSFDGYPQNKLPRAWFAKGSYFSYQGHVPFQHLIYPVPVNGGLGVHLTLDLQGQARFGPDVEWLLDGQTFDFQVQEAKRSTFAAAVKRYWPDMLDARLCPDYAGIRPKISGPHEKAADFMIQDERQHGVKGLINLFGIESPGLTSCLAIAEHVSSLLAK